MWETKAVESGMLVGFCIKTPATTSLLHLEYSLLYQTHQLDSTPNRFTSLNHAICQFKFYLTSFNAYLDFNRQLLSLSIVPMTANLIALAPSKFISSTLFDMQVRDLYLVSELKATSGWRCCCPY